jgi:hypothetical protein
MGLALYRPRVRSNDLLGIRFTWHNFWTERAVTVAPKCTANRRVEKRNDARIVVCDCVDVINRHVRGHVHVPLTLLPREEVPSTIDLIARFLSVHEPDALAFNHNVISRDTRAPAFRERPDGVGGKAVAL